MLVPFSGSIFKFPLINEQLKKYLTQEDSIPFKVINTKSNEVIGHSEIYKEENNIAKLCRILIGNKILRGKGIGEKIVTKLVEYSFDNLNVEKVELNVYDWNKSAIKCYEKSVFEMKPKKVSQIEVKRKTWISLNMLLEKNKSKINKKPNG